MKSLICWKNGKNTFGNIDAQCLLSSSNYESRVECGMHISLETRLQNLKRFTVIAIERAIEMAKGGEKDKAREWANYFESSGLVHVLADPEQGVLTGAEYTRLKIKLEELRGNCHPLDVPDFTNDFIAIRQNLELILHRIEMQDHKCMICHPTTRATGGNAAARKDSASPAVWVFNKRG